MLIISLVLSIGIPIFFAAVIHPKYMTMMLAHAETDAVSLASHLLSDEVYSRLPLQKTSFGKADQIKLGIFKQDFKLYKLKIFSPEGETLFSTSPDDIGRMNTKDYFQNIVAKGEIVTKAVRKNQKTLEDQIAHVDLVECYVPIMNSGMFSGAFEVYLDVTERFNSLKSLYAKTMLWVCSFSILIVVFVVLSLWFSGGQLMKKERADQKLKENEAHFRSISSSVNDALITIDHKGNIIFWNDAAETIFGYTKEEVTGKALHPLLVPGKYMDAFRKGFEGFVRDGTGAALGKLLELTALRKNGEEFPIELSLAAYPTSDGWYAVGTIRDISDRKQWEREKENLIQELKSSLDQIKTLEGMVPICAHCKNIRDDKGYWNQVESYINLSDGADLSHGICPDCAEKYYPDMNLYEEDDK